MNHFKTKICILWMILLVGGCTQTDRMIIVCIGDSLATCGGPGGTYCDYLAQWLPSHHIINKGIGGDTLQGGRNRFDADVMKFEPDIVVIQLGGNDFLLQNREIAALQGDLEYMVRRAKASGAQVVIASVFGGRDYAHVQNLDFLKQKAEFAAAIETMERQIVDQYDCLYVPNIQADIGPNGDPNFWSDIFHPNQAGNEFVARRILAELKKAISHVSVM